MSASCTAIQTSSSANVPDDFLAPEPAILSVRETATATLTASGGQRELGLHWSDTARRRPDACCKARTGDADVLVASPCCKMSAASSSLSLNSPSDSSVFMSAGQSSMLSSSLSPSSSPSSSSSASSSSPSSTSLSAHSASSSHSPSLFSDSPSSPSLFWPSSWKSSSANDGSSWALALSSNLAAADSLSSSKDWSSLPTDSPSGVATAA
mmetsp:Transcript_29558/g.80869  ORF Transcript_29558/g.80869 Transcript_29558/m.80869 type:complete len:210 (-) Transcript_29558:41-670(-)